MSIVAVELVIGVVVVVLVAVLARLAWLIAHRKQGPTITEAQARENASPLTTAILPPNGRHRKGRDQRLQRQQSPKQS